MVYKFKPEGVCSMEMQVDIEDGIIKEAKIVGGCPGNTVGISKLVEGMRISDIIKKIVCLTLDLPVNRRTAKAVIIKTNIPDLFTRCMTQKTDSIVHSKYNTHFTVHLGDGIRYATIAKPKERSKP